MNKTKRIMSLLMTAVIAFSALTASVSAVETSKKNWKSMFVKQYNSLAVTLTSNEKLTAKMKAKGQYIFFLSVTDGSEQATVTHMKCQKQNRGLRETALAARNKLDTAPLYMRLDAVDSIYPITYSELKEAVAENRICWYRHGIAFDENLETALLESELNANGLLDYETGEIKLNELNKYLKNQGKDTLKSIPEQLYRFNCVSYFCDESNTVYELETDYYNRGRRIVDTDKAFVKDIIKNTGAYLADIIYDDGSFDYEKHPIVDESADDYNIVRHAGTVWNLINLYSIGRDKSLLAPIERALDYMVERMKYENGNAYFVDEYNRASAGGNALAALAFADYAQYIDSNKYKEVTIALGNSLVSMMNEDGSINHKYKITNGKAVMTKAFSCVYYDGEAAFALARMYTVFKEKKYLDSACGLADYFIANSYDDASNVHWIAYSMNEITKHIGKKEYYSFGLGHIEKYAESIGKRTTASPAPYEALVASFEMYTNMKDDGINISFDIEKLLTAIAKRTDFGYNYYMFPETAMFFKDPNEIIHGFAIREDNFRMRIDDTQHFMGGYCSYYRNYAALSEYMTAYGLIPDEIAA